MDSAWLQHLIAQYGYLAVLVGTLLEGETILILGGFAAHRGYLDLPWVIAVAALGGWLGDQIWFWLGRTRGNAVLARFPSVHQQGERVKRLLERHQNGIILLIRFIYGLRTAGPVVIGMSAVSPWRFALLNAIGAIIWAIAFGGAGYVFGHAIEVVLKDAERYEKIAIIAIAAIGAAVWLYRRGRSRRSPTGSV